MDYMGSVIQTKEQIYKDIRSRYSVHSQEYIDAMLDQLYESGFINEEVSVSGWLVFVAQEVVHKLDEFIQRDTERAKARLLLGKCLVPKNDISQDLIEEISKMM